MKQLLTTFVTTLILTNLIGQAKFSVEDQYMNASSSAGTYNFNYYFEEGSNLIKVELRRNGIWYIAQLKMSKPNLPKFIEIFSPCASPQTYPASQSGIIDSSSLITRVRCIGNLIDATYISKKLFGKYYTKPKLSSLSTQNPKLVFPDGIKIGITTRSKIESLYGLGSISQTQSINYPDKGVSFVFDKIGVLYWVFLSKYK